MLDLTKLLIIILSTRLLNTLNINGLATKQRIQGAYNLEFSFQFL